MPFGQTGDDVGKAAVLLQMCGQLPQPIRGERGRRGRIHMLTEL